MLLVRAGFNMSDLLAMDIQSFDCLSLRFDRLSTLERAESFMSDLTSSNPTKDGVDHYMSPIKKRLRKYGVEVGKDDPSTDSRKAASMLNRNTRKK